MRSIFKSLSVLSIFVLAFSTAVPFAFAAGNISSTSKYSQMTKDLDGDGTNDFINWNPTNGGATVTDTAVTGYIWGESIGWIKLNPAHGGVTNDCSGNLGGTAWGAGIGWINFSPSHPTVSPHINLATGEISGQVWSAAMGWIELASSDPSHPGLTTTWTGCASGGPGGGSGPSYTPSVSTGPSGGSPAPASPSVVPPGTSPTGPGSSPSGPGPSTPTGPSPSGPSSSPSTGILPINNIPMLPIISTQVGGVQSFGWLLPILALIGLLGTIPGLAVRFSNLFLTFILARRKMRGIVYDAVTKEPLDPAYVSVIDMATGQEIMNQITDMEGRYGFVLKKGTYKLVANKTHYQFPSVRLAGRNADEVYDHLYFGEPFTVVDEEQVVTMNIPMDPLAADWNQEEKRRMNWIKYFIHNPKTLVWFFNTLFVIGFFVSIILTYLSPVWWNILMTILYVVIGILQVTGFGSITAGKITKAGQPLPYAIVRVFNADLNREVAHKVTTDLGGYYILVPKAEYYVTIEQKNADGTYTKLFTSDRMRAGHGMINRSFEI